MRDGCGEDGVIGIVVYGVWEVRVFGGVLHVDVAQALYEDCQQCSTVRNQKGAHTWYDAQPCMLCLVAPELCCVFWGKHRTGLEARNLLRKRWRESCNVSRELVLMAFRMLLPSLLH